MTEAEELHLRARLAELKQEHLDLDAAIGAMANNASADPLMLRRIKKRKLQLKDMISAIEDTLLPDIIA